jgi:hypothetical protein
MCLIDKGWKIIMNFMAPDCILGNVAVKLGDKWFAIGECRKTEMAFHTWHKYGH